MTTDRRTLTAEQVRRYARHILLPELGGRGQERLLAGSVTVEVGPGRAAAVVALAYLAAAGVGRLVVAGDPHGRLTGEEIVGGILFGPADLGRTRLLALAERIALLNPDVTVVAEERPTGGLRLDELAAAGPTDDVADALVRGGQAAARAIATLGGVAPAPPVAVAGAPDALLAPGLDGGLAGGAEVER